MGVIRVLSDDQIEDLLRTAIVGRIACCAHGEPGDGRPYLVPLAYGYDGESIYAHSGPGRKLDFMRAEPRVTFEVDRADARDRLAAELGVRRNGRGRDWRRRGALASARAREREERDRDAPEERPAHGQPPARSARAMLLHARRRAMPTAIQ